MSEIEIYKTSDNQTEIEVRFDGETVWLNQYQLAELFETDRTSLLKHIQNIYSSHELEENSTCAKIAQVRKEGKREVKREVLHYNLDAILSVGYRVNSKRGTQFRQWATQRLKDYLVKGFAINEKRLIETKNQLVELRKTIELLNNVVLAKSLSTDETQGLFKVLADYTFALDILDKYDHQSLETPGQGAKELFRITYKEAKKAIDSLKKKFGGSALFGNEKDQSFISSLETIYQTFDGTELYSMLEEKAAHLLYFVVKNHSFSDGNKRIAAFLFVWFLERNDLLYFEGKKMIDDNALVALTLMIAESKPDDKDMMIKVIINLITNRK